MSRTRYQEGWIYGAKATQGKPGYVLHDNTQLEALELSDPGWVDGYRHGHTSAVCMTDVAEAGHGDGTGHD